jgi:hypothetical protein
MRSAFNAALVVFGCFLIGRSEAKIHSDFANVTATDTTALLNKAIAATENVDKGNHIVDRCTHYLRLLVNVARIMGS